MKKMTVLLFTLFLFGCHSDNDNSTSEVNPSNPSNIAEELNLSSEDITENDQNQSVFITNLSLPVSIEIINKISFEIVPKENTFSDTIKATISSNRITQLNNEIEFPVFGLYDNYDNTVNITVTFTDESTTRISKIVRTSQYIDENSIYDNITVNQPIFNIKTQL